MKLHCEFCDATRNLQRHHIIPISEGGDKGFLNRIFVCIKHHSLLHGRSINGPTIKSTRDNFFENREDLLKYRGYLGKRKDRHQKVLGDKSSMKLREMAIKYGIPSWGLPYLSMIKRLVKSNALSEDEEDVLRSICKELKVDYDKIFGKNRGGK